MKKTMGEIMTLLALVLFVLGLIDYFYTKYLEDLQPWAAAVVGIVVIVLAWAGAGIKRREKEREMRPPAAKY